MDQEVGLATVDAADPDTDADQGGDSTDLENRVDDGAEAIAPQFGDGDHDDVHPGGYGGSHERSSADGGFGGLEASGLGGGTASWETLLITTKTTRKRTGMG